MFDHKRATIHNKYNYSAIRFEWRMHIKCFANSSWANAIVICRTEELLFPLFVLLEYWQLLRGRSPQVIVAWKFIFKQNHSMYSNINRIRLHCFRSIGWRRWYRYFLFYWMPLNRIRPTIFYECWTPFYLSGDMLYAYWVRAWEGHESSNASRVFRIFSLQ